MTNRDMTREAREEALLGELLRELAREEGRRLERENEALQADPDAAVPKEAESRCQLAIRRAKSMPGGALPPLLRRRPGKAAAAATALMGAAMLLPRGLLRELIGLIR